MSLSSSKKNTTCCIPEFMSRLPNESDEAQMPMADRSSKGNAVYRQKTSLTKSRFPHLLTFLFEFKYFLVE